MPNVPNRGLEDAARAAGHKTVAGVDEVGRGPWAGPVVAAAAVLDLENLPAELLSNLDDSKKLSKLKREALSKTLQNSPHVQYAIGIAEVDDIDLYNILQASLMAMSRAVTALPKEPDFALVDGNREPILPCPLETVIKGDRRSVSIAAASIIAKVHRDRIMAALGGAFPGYGWETNAGYGTAAHQTGLRHLGVTPHHRKSFKPVQQFFKK